MRHLWIFVIIIGLCIASLPAISIAQDKPSPNDAPYLYYFTPLLNAFVIERADGSDSRIFGENIMPEGTDIVSGAGWSPSGNWFAWTAATFSRTAVENYHPYVLSVDGQTQIHLPSEIQNADMKWSPNQDILFILDIDVNVPRNNDYYAPTRIYIILPEQNQVFLLASFDYAEFQDVYWIDNFGIVQILLSEAENYSMIGIIFNQDGVIRKKSILYQFGLRNFSNNYVISPTGQITYGDGVGNFIFENILTDEMTTVEWIDFDTRNVAIEWNNKGTHALIFNEQDLYLYSVADNLIEFIHADVEAEGYYPYWSPDGQTAVFVTGQLYFQINLEEVSIQPIIVSSYPELLRQSLTWTWISNYQIATEYLSWEPEVKVVEVYNVQTGEISTRHVNYPVRTTFSNDGQYFVANGIFNNIQVYALDSDEFYELMPHSRTSWDGGLIETRWHPSDYWVMTYEHYAANTFRAMVQVFNIDGSIRRELTGSCVNYEICSNWLPLQVNVDQLPHGQEKSVLPEAIEVIHTPNWVMDISWSPDSKQIATLNGSYPRYAIPAELMGMYVWDVETHTEISFEEADSYDYYEIRWELIGDNYSAIAHEFSFEDTQSELAEYPLATHPDNIQQILVDPDDPNWNSVVVRDPVTNEILHTADGNKVAYSPDGKYLAVGGAFAQVRILDTVTWEELAVLNVYTGGLDFSPDGQYLAVGSSWDVQIWDVADLLTD